MSEVPLTLFVDLREGSRIELETAAKAAIAWSHLIKSVGRQIDPFHEWAVELESSLPGSQKIRSIIKLPDTVENRTALKAAVASSLIFITLGAGEWAIGTVLDYLTGQDAPPAVVDPSDEERRQLAEEIVQVLRSNVGHEEAVEVYQALEEDRAVTGAGATSSRDQRPELLVPRSHFPLSHPEGPTEEGARRTRTEQIDLILVRPVLTSHTSKKWGFESLYGSFNAAIRDAKFLSALAEGRLNIPLAQGIRMIVELEITEQQVGGLWRPVERVVSQVVKVIPPPVQQSFGLEGPQ